MLNLLKNKLTGSSKDKEKIYFDDISEIDVQEEAQSNVFMSVGLGQLNQRKKKDSKTIRVVGQGKDVFDYANGEILSPGKRKWEGDENAPFNYKNATTGAESKMSKEPIKLADRKPFTGREYNQQNVGSSGHFAHAIAHAEPKSFTSVESTLKRTSSYKNVMDDKDGDASKDVRFETSRQEAEKVDTSYSFVYPSASNASSTAPTSAPPTSSSSSSSSSVYEFDDLPTDEEQITYLFSKIRHNRIDLVQDIISIRKVEPNVRDDKGNTMLHIACQNNLRKMCSLLLKHGVDINAANFKLMTALDYCEAYKFDSLAQFLISRGAVNGNSNGRRHVPASSMR